MNISLVFLNFEFFKNKNLKRENFMLFNYFNKYT